MAHSTPIDDLRDRSPAAWLRERDIDLLVCSELWAEGSPLRRLFAGRWNDGDATFEGAWVSHQDADGETDIVVSFVSGPGSLILLVENKIDAEFQPDQAERYRQRGMRWRERGGPSVDVETVLLAPAEYFGREDSDTFDWHLSYEDLVDLLNNAVDPRSQFLAYILSEGIRTYRQGYVPVPDATNTQVWRAFWDIANEETPRLRMRRPGDKPSGAGFIYFYDAEGVSSAETEGRAHIVYKHRPGRDCEVDLQFRQTSEASLRTRAAELLEDDMSVVKAGNSASIRVRVPAVDFSRIPEGQEDGIRAGLHAAERLRRFFVDRGVAEILEPG